MSNDPVYTIQVDIHTLIPEGSPIGRDAFPHLANAVEKITAAAHERWSAFARGYPLPNGKVIQNRTGEYLRSIQVRSTGDFSGEVFSVLPYAVAIEQGAPARDMKRILDTSPKVRLTKDGRRYLIIPFRHNNPESVLGHRMPSEVWNWWHREGREPSVVTGTYRRASGTGAFDIRTRKLTTVPGWRYKWGTRLTSGDLEELGFRKGDKMAKRLQGMVNFRVEGATGGASNSKYLNFRTMTQGSPGWVAPAREGYYPAGATAEELRPIAEEVFREAVTEDVKRLLGGE